MAMAIRPSTLIPLLLLLLFSFQTCIHSTLELPLGENSKVLYPISLRIGEIANRNAQSSASVQVEELSLTVDQQVGFSRENSVVADESSVTDLLIKYGLPIGLLPTSAVTSFSLSENGEFEINFEKPCYANFEYDVSYAEKITGQIDYGSISDLSGIRAKRSFIWVSVRGIRVDIPSSGYIYFEIGLISKKLSLSLFEQVPECSSRDLELRSPAILE